ncbi:hypothetical protein SEA_RIPARIAN_50 [Mycobacterium phage Riparian]|uniref:Helix-turn-helix DNA binding protein n=2 Tax=Papyrusvirus send513 TaxID=1982556 RepID=A0A3G3LX21_9CAUD|nr:hypothetical protein SEA_RIPARIAN_50 [Mycobacterium phage Riparian]
MEMAARKMKVVKSIQVEKPTRFARVRKGKGQNSTRELQARSLKAAANHGQPWSDDEVARIVAGIQRDETSFELALAVGRSYYSTMSARSHVAFAMRHANALELAVKQAARAKHH